ncbi:MAG: plasmid recombination protein [Eubacterium sp.]|nr:plasmid recombination protein [Eubacterium sp.]
MSDFAIFRMEKVKSISNMAHRSIHNIRKNGFLATDQNEDKSKIKVVIFEDTPLKDVYEKKQTYAEFFKDKLKEYGIKKVRKNAVVGMELVMTYSNNKEIPLRDWVKKNVEWVIENFGKHNLFECRMHEEGLETSNHLHFLISPFYYNEEKDKYVLSANSIVSGPSKLIELQDSYAEAMSAFGLERGLKRVDKEEHKRAMKWWSEQAKNERRLEAYEKTFGKESDWSIEEAAEFKMLSRPELKDDSKKPVLTRIQVER